MGPPSARGQTRPPPPPLVAAPSPVAPTPLPASRPLHVYAPSFAGPPSLDYDFPELSSAEVGNAKSNVPIGCKEGALEAG